ncbi:hypothetical protein NXS19_000644 [Fusarium pseudograminearum]|nr:hypothetical protein NXS19_000644 [Fusarium pseudograminearum]
MWSNCKVTCTYLAFQVVAVLPSPLRSILSLSPSRNTAHRALSVPTEPISTTSNIIQEMSSRGGKLAPEVNRALFVKNLSYNVTPEELFDLFGKFGPIRQVRQDVTDAKQACDKLNGFNFQNRYLVVLYHQPDKMAKSKEDLEARRESLAQLKQQHGRSSSSPKSPSPDPKTILRKGRTPTKRAATKSHASPESSALMTDFDLH